MMTDDGDSSSKRDNTNTYTYALSLLHKLGELLDPPSPEALLDLLVRNVSKKMPPLTVDELKLLHRVKERTQVDEWKCILDFARAEKRRRKPLHAEAGESRDAEAVESYDALRKNTCTQQRDSHSVRTPAMPRVVSMSMCSYPSEDATGTSVQSKDIHKSDLPIMLSKTSLEQSRVIRISTIDANQDDHDDDDVDDDGDVDDDVDDDDSGNAEAKPLDSKKDGASINSHATRPGNFDLDLNNAGESGVDEGHAVYTNKLSGRYDAFPGEKVTQVDTVYATEGGYKYGTYDDFKVSLKAQVKSLDRHGGTRHRTELKQLVKDCNKLIDKFGIDVESCLLLQSVLRREIEAYKVLTADEDSKANEGNLLHDAIIEVIKQLPQEQISAVRKSAEAFGYRYASTPPEGANYHTKITKKKPFDGDGDSQDNSDGDDTMGAKYTARVVQPSQSPSSASATHTAFFSPQMGGCDPVDSYPNDRTSKAASRQGWAPSPRRSPGNKTETSFRSPKHYQEFDTVSNLSGHDIGDLLFSAGYNSKYGTGYDCADVLTDISGHAQPHFQRMEPLIQSVCVCMDPPPGSDGAVRLDTNTNTVSYVYRTRDTRTGKGGRNNSKAHVESAEYSTYTIDSPRKSPEKRISLASHGKGSYGGGSSDGARITKLGGARRSSTLHRRQFTFDALMGLHYGAHSAKNGPFNYLSNYHADLLPMLQTHTRNTLLLGCHATYLCTSVPYESVGVGPSAPSGCNGCMEESVVTGTGRGGFRANPAGVEPTVRMLLGNCGHHEAASAVHFPPKSRNGPPSSRNRTLSHAQSTRTQVNVGEASSTSRLGRSTRSRISDPGTASNVGVVSAVAGELFRALHPTMALLNQKQAALNICADDLEGFSTRKARAKRVMIEDECVSLRSKLDFERRCANVTVSLVLYTPATPLNIYDHVFGSRDDHQSTENGDADSVTGRECMIDLLASSGSRTGPAFIQRNRDGTAQIANATKVLIHCVADLERVLGIVMGRRLAARDIYNTFSVQRPSERSNSKERFTGGYHDEDRLAAAWYGMQAPHAATVSDTESSTFSSAHKKTDDKRDEKSADGEGADSPARGQAANQAAAGNAQSERSSHCYLLVTLYTNGVRAGAGKSGSTLPFRTQKLQSKFSFVCPVGPNFAHPGGEMAFLSEALSCLPHPPSPGLLQSSPLVTLLANPFGAPTRFTKLAALSTKYPTSASASAQLRTNSERHGEEEYARATILPGATHGRTDSALASLHFASNTR